MITKVKLPQIICIFAMLLAVSRPTVADTADVQQLHRSFKSFGHPLSPELAVRNAAKNIVVSPFSMQTDLNTAALEIVDALASSVQEIENSAYYYPNIFLAGSRLTDADTANDQQLDKSFEYFGHRLSAELAVRNAAKNLASSLFSIQMAAREIDQALASSVQEIENLAYYYHNMFLAASRPTVADAPDDQQLGKSLEYFGHRLSAELAVKNAEKNIVFSPFSIQTGLAMARMGAEGQTAFEIDQGLASSVQKPENLAYYYHNILAKYENNPNLIMANKIYVKTGYALQDEFNELLSKKFFSKAESLNFAQSQSAANTINSWVEEKTNHLIKNLVKPDLLDDTTRLVLVNAIHFKGAWVHPFWTEFTREMDFHLDDTRTTKVQMMGGVEADLKYADLDDLDAKALEMPYKDSEFSMLVILPNKRTGLVELENKLKNIAISEITQRMSSTNVKVLMPKFKSEFQEELEEPLSKMGIKRMFLDDAEFGKMLKSGEGLKVSSIIHKATVEVNENGTEAAAASAALISNKMSRSSKKFVADRPFFYVIKNANNLVLFQGNLKNNL